MLTEIFNSDEKTPCGEMSHGSVIRRFSQMYSLWVKKISSSKLYPPCKIFIDIYIADIKGMVMDYFEKKLSYVKENGLYRGDFKYLNTEQAPKVVIENRDIILLGSNNYLGLCNDSRLKEAAMEATAKYGVGSGGARLTTGSYELHKKLEEKIARFKCVESSLIYTTGYMANTGIISAICDRKWTIFCDKNNHASIVDGALLSGARIIRYKHCNMGDLERKVHTNKGDNNLIITDGVFSMDGDVAPLTDIVGIAKKYGCLTMVDDAHGFGVLGENGSGTVSHFNLNGQIDIQMGTLSKAVASVGGYAAGKKGIIDYLKNFSRSFIFSTALPPSTIAVSLKSIEIIENDNDRRQHLKELSDWFRTELKESGFTVSGELTPIIPVITGGADETVELCNNLYAEGIYVPAIRPPTVPRGTSRLRISLMATHTREDLQYVVAMIKKHGKKVHR
ncbi:8-amino-7-oxononanoate synthase [Anaerobacterium chartisolvens]|uniref:8-amino-7-ketopelargonate synthase n=1 Tax=Anaerobacterium chartisolvens TaxID=1297424 RepID=A0A369BAM7_9FIRM|nr:8-amino-7-oxononanoate synthase [Anaerobacterium chartisolvens]RCX18375.1 8-amino-7-oxononanoate synthase [Anaerobacterium chartisolvens]